MGNVRHRSSISPPRLTRSSSSILSGWFPRMLPMIMMTMMLLLLSSASVVEPATTATRTSTDSTTKDGRPVSTLEESPPFSSSRQQEQEQHCSLSSEEACSRLTVDSFTKETNQKGADDCSQNSPKEKNNVDEENEEEAIENKIRKEEKEGENKEEIQEEENDEERQQREAIEKQIQKNERQEKENGQAIKKQILKEENKEKDDERQEREEKNVEQQREQQQHQEEEIQIPQIVEIQLSEQKNTPPPPLPKETQEEQRLTTTTNYELVTTDQDYNLLSSSSSTSQSAQQQQQQQQQQPRDTLTGTMMGEEWGIPQRIIFPFHVPQLPNHEAVMEWKLKEIHSYMTNFLRSWSSSSSSSSTESSSPPISSCRNHHAQCTYWAVTGECEEHPTFMSTECAPSCQVCFWHLYDRQWDYMATPSYWEGISHNNGDNGGVPQWVNPRDPGMVSTANRMISYMERRYYMSSQQQQQQQQQQSGPVCRNEDSQCIKWAAAGECTSANRPYMTKYCAPSCQTCHLLERTTTTTATPDPRILQQQQQQHAATTTGVAPGPEIDTTVAAEEAKMVKEATSSSTSSKPSTATAIMMTPIPRDDWKTTKLTGSTSSSSSSSSTAPTADLKTCAARKTTSTIHGNRNQENQREDTSSIPRQPTNTHNITQDSSSKDHDGDSLLQITTQYNVWGVPQEVPLDHPAQQGIEQVLERLDPYMRSMQQAFNWDSTKCRNRDAKCAYWASLGECDANANYMNRHCAPVCQSCAQLIGRNNSKPSQSSPKSNEDKDGHIMHDVNMNKKDRSDDVQDIIPFGEAQLIPSGEHGEETQRLITAMQVYMHQTVLVKEEYARVKDHCKCNDWRCAAWAAEGECEKNPTFMNVQCAPVCQTCEYVSYEYRCPIDKNDPAVFSHPGDLNRMFHRVMDNPYYQEQYAPAILSSPETTNGPWVIQFDNFLSEEECEILIQLGSNKGYGASVTVGTTKPDGTMEGNAENPGRTSKTAWCDGPCQSHERTKQVWERLVNVTGVSDRNSEHLQLLRYQEGQFYTVHHDYLEHHFNQPHGVRILTFFMYLNDVAAGGGTHFPLLNVTIMPKRGRAVLWPSVLDEDPNAKDFRTDHEALPVEEGVKYGANAWFHQHDFLASYEKGCT